eukprot:Skav202717  [mRNA]  locus=scaffold654:812778:820834:+ [translate_table: standard]
MSPCPSPWLDLLSIAILERSRSSYCCGGLLRVIKTVDTAKLSERLLENMREEIQVQGVPDEAVQHIGIIALAKEKCSGGDLDELLDRAGHFPEELVAHLIRQVLSGIAFCHAWGVVHRDLKPGNVMLTSEFLKNQSSSFLAASPCATCVCEESHLKPWTVQSDALAMVGW